MLLRNRKSEESNAYICNVSMKREKERDGKFLRRIFVLSSSVSSSIADIHLRSLFRTFSQICFLMYSLLFFFLNKTSHTYTYIHIYIYIHNAPMFEQKKEKTFLFEIFSYFELLKRKKISIHRLWKKKISPAKKRLVE